MDGIRECRKCLLKDMSDQDYYNSITEYIKHLPEDEKADDKLYERRLNLCRDCEQLINGMCRLCGCFVEVRAAKQISHCAWTADLW